MFNQQVITNGNIAPETKLWKIRVFANGGALAANSLTIANSFVKNLRTKSYYNKIVYLLPMLGVGIQAAKVPLIDKLNKGVATIANFVNADFSETSGLAGNASNKLLDLPFSAGELGANFNAGMGFWELNASAAAGTQYGIGAWNTGGIDTFGLRFGNGGGDVNCQFYYGSNSSAVTLAELRSNSHYYGNRSSSTSRALYKNGNNVGSSVVSEAATGSVDFTLASYALHTGIGTYLVYWGGRKALEYYTDGTMTDNDMADFHQLLMNFLMIPSRKI